MKSLKRKLRITLVMLLILTGALVAQDHEGEEKSGEAAGQAAMIEHMTPGQAHERLTKDVGEWKVAMTLFTPNGELKSEGTATMEMALGGRFLVTRLKADVMGMPFDGLGYQGYDNAKKVFTSIWMDNMGTSMTFAEGKIDADNDSLVFKGEMYSPEAGGNVHYRSVSKTLGENHLSFEMFMEADGKFTRSFLMEYTK